MEDLYSIHPGIAHGALHDATSAPAPDPSEVLKAQIAGHPRYPSLLSAYVQCRKVLSPLLSSPLLLSIYLLVNQQADR